jgi:predicted PurR-regulated permease PerM
MGAMIVISTELLLPFLPALIWATMVVLSTWPLLLRAQARLGGRRTTAVAVMTIGLLLLLIGPVLFAVLVIINHAGEIVSWGRPLSDVTIPPPEWLERLPVAGAKIAAVWQNFSTTGLEDLSVHVAPSVCAAAPGPRDALRRSPLRPAQYRKTRGRRARSQDR